MDKAKLDPTDVEELAIHIIGLDPDIVEEDFSLIETKLMEEFNIDLNYFEELLSRIVPLIHYSSSPMSKEIYKGFINKEDLTWILKIKAD